MPASPATQAPKKRLVLCCDGTWNKPDKNSDSVRVPTNVAKLARGLLPKADDTPQLLYYQRGVGTRHLEHIRGGAFGYGLSRNVRDCYRFIVANYQPRDQLYFFGFSRGAYTARSTVGLIRNCGILRPEHADRIDEAYSLYRSRSNRAHPETVESELFRQMYAHDSTPPTIHFIGVWDTVGSLGIPIDWLAPQVLARRWSFHDTTLSSTVLAAYQALAIDERRGPFKPALWNQADAQAPTEADRHAATQAPAAGDDRVLEQVWFAGVHSDVGGGYANPALAEIPLLWMVNRAREHDLEFAPDHFEVAAGSDPPPTPDRERGRVLAPHALGEIHKPLKGFYWLLPRHRRRLTNDNNQSVATSAVRRLQTMRGYSPKSLKKWHDHDWATTAVQDGS